MVPRPTYSLFIAAAGLLLVMGVRGDVLPLNPGASISGTVTPSQGKDWQLETNAGTYIRISIRAADAALNAKLLDASGKSIQDATSIGGTGGLAMLAWISEPGNGHDRYKLELKMAGNYPPHCNFSLKVEEYRPAKTGEDPQSFPLIKAESLVLKARKMMTSQHGREALSVLDEALSDARALGDERLEAQALYARGMAHYYLGERQAALESLQHALELQRKWNQPYEMSLTLNNIAAVQQLLGECRQAVEGFQEALKLRQMVRDQRGAGYTLFGLANAYYCTGESQESLDSDLRALQIWRDLKDTQNEAETQNTLAVVYLQLGDWEDSRQALNAALELWKKTGNRSGEGRSIYNVGLLDDAIGDTAGALQREQQALAIFQEMKDQRGAAYALEEIGEAYGRKGDHAKALENLEQSRGLLQAIGEGYEEGYLWQSLGNEYSTLHRDSDARAAYDRALALEKQVGDSQGEAVTLFRLAKFDSEAGQSSAALDSVNQSIGLVEQSRKQVLDPAHRAMYLATKREMYALKVSLLMKSGDSAGAFETSDAAHARSLLDEVTDAPTKSGSTLPKDPQLATVRDIQSHLDSRSVFIEYLARNDASYGWAITAGGILAFPLPPRRTLETLAQELYESVTARNERVPGETLETRAQRLARAQALAHSTEARLNGMLFGSIPAGFRKPRMLIVPDGPLYLVPFSLLRATTRAEMAESPSASVFLAEEREGSAGSLIPALVVADPVMRADSLPELEFASRDALVLSRVLQPSEIEILEKEKATASAFESSDVARFGLIHIAAHAVVDMSHPLKTGVILSDGKLSAAAISNLEIHARLVTLSACDTAVGKEIEGEGIMSLSRAFLHAGAGAVLSTLWPIDDEATSEFMQSFYTELLKKHMSASQALREARLHMQAARTWSDPFYWAAFTLQGDPWR